MKISQIYMTLLMGFTFTACGDAKFTSTKPSNSGINNQSVFQSSSDQQVDRFPDGTQNDRFGTGDFGTMKDDLSDPNSGGGKAGIGTGSGKSKEQLKQECWFAVSGSFLPAPNNAYGSVFPRTLSGNPIGHGEQFDTVGGVYLAARDQPYEYGQGDREIDGAIDHTFDGIAIAPGMKVTIKDGSGRVLTESEGPLVAISSYYFARSAESYWNTLKTKTDLPNWMNQLVNDRALPSNINLQPARSVKVEAIPGSDCDFEQ